ncbi:hypothetical protein [Bradyrhizobium sp. AUGA SZCCT0182]|uniref:hypothetical protein n=1 Tax=Bradyrhizobium sp. AUGA SZCCT0182 TaxID=2807667 RepID=UPI001BA847BB|nr:hypothetical protein [Bradyrhizobium sp. AUGA SZCCT0182]MBR1236541.1 hypothetical protein [Bradyrhizobium sp. AUGA SZCCT0182]
MSYVSEEYSAVVVNFPSDRNADFASRWLTRIAEADRILTLHRQENPEFEKTIEPLGVVSLVEFSWPALELVRRWLHDSRAFPLSSRDYELFEAVSYLAETGFFASDGAHYHVTLPLH